MYESKMRQADTKKGVGISTAAGGVAAGGLPEKEAEEAEAEAEAETE